MKNKFLTGSSFPQWFCQQLFCPAFFYPIGRSRRSSKSSTSDAVALTENPTVSDASVAGQAESPSAESGESRATSEEAVGKADQAPAAAQAAASGPEVVPNVGTIQGESQASPYEDKEVQVSNIVVTKTDRYGFYVPRRDS